MPWDARVAIFGAILAFIVPVWLFHRQRKDERESVNRAVLAEVKRLLTVVTKHRDWWANLSVEERPSHPLIPFTTEVYAAQLNNVGLLQKNLVNAIVTFYGYVAFVNSLQQTRAAYDQHNASDKFHSAYLKSLNKLILLFADRFDNALKSV